MELQLGNAMPRNSDRKEGVGKQMRGHFCSVNIATCYEKFPAS